MPEWINAFQRKPLKYGQYFVKLNGRKDIIRQEEFDKFKERYDDFFWLDEEAKSNVVIKKEGLISSLKNGSMKDYHIRRLENLLGIKKADKIKEFYKVKK